MSSSQKCVGALAALVLFAGCGGGDEPECETEPDCGPGMTCTENVCVPLTTGDGGGANCGGESWNLLQNGSFECGAEGWLKSFANFEIAPVTEGAKVGAQALRLTSTGSVSFHVSSNEVTVPAGTVCARAWMRGTTNNGHLRVVWSAVDGTEGKIESFSSPVKVDEWVPFQATKALAVVLPKESKVHVRVAAASESNGTWLEADDVRLWRSEDGSCSEH